MGNFLNDLNKIIEIDNMNQKAYLKRAEIYEKINKLNESYKDYEKALLIGKILEKNKCKL